MSIFETALNPVNFYNYIFINIVPVTEYKNITELKNNNPKAHKIWAEICKTKYNHSDPFNVEGLNRLYMSKAVYYPEFSKIAAITTAKVEMQGDKIERYFQRFLDDDEEILLKNFVKYLYEQNKQYMLCGNNIKNIDIPFIAKRLLKYRDNFEKKHVIPHIIKKYLMGKPWDDTIVDIQDLWRFNGMGSSFIQNITQFLNLKINIDLMEHGEINTLYWNTIDDDKEMIMKILRNQSANQVNLFIQIMNIFKNI